jgi:hypothetical protein
MTLVILGLLFGLAGIVWVIVLDMVWKDRQCQEPGLHDSKRT